MALRIASASSRSWLSNWASRVLSLTELAAVSRRSCMAMTGFFFDITSSALPGRTDTVPSSAT
ncbi:hypothetical protein LT337_08830 [Mycolicibacterium fortuitum]|nr:hypothetical protein LT337_08830 [Mycolicibacterium fortuitum]